MASTTHAPSGSKQLFSGYPAFVADTYDWQDDFENVLGRAIESAVDFASKSLRYAASRDKSWAPYVSNLSVQYKDGALHWILSGSDDDIAAMTALEYGGPKQAPRPLLRTQLARQNSILAHKIDIVLAQEVPVA